MAIRISMAFGKRSSLPIGTCKIMKRKQGRTQK